MIAGKECKTNGLLKKLTNCYGPSSREGGMVDLIKENIEEYVDDIKVDNLGNLIAHKKGLGNKKKLMISAHMDQIGLMITGIDESGFLKFFPIGYSNPHALLGQRIIFENGTQGVASVSENMLTEKITLKDMYIDIGASSKKEVEKNVKIGDICTYKPDYYENDEIIISNALDNRISCYILISIIQKELRGDYDVYYVFSSQEEVGVRGASTASYEINPDIALSLDSTTTGDVPGTEMECKIGGGVAIKLMDRLAICDREIVDNLVNLAQDELVPICFQYEIMTAGGTDLGAIQTKRNGVKVGGISVPTRHVHTAGEIVNKSDVKSCIDLLSTFIECSDVC